MPYWGNRWWGVLEDAEEIEFRVSFSKKEIDRHGKLTINQWNDFVCDLHNKDLPNKKRTHDIDHVEEGMRVEIGFELVGEIFEDYLDYEEEEKEELKKEMNKCLKEMMKKTNTLIIKRKKKKTNTNIFRYAVEHTETP